MKQVHINTGADKNRHAAISRLTRQEGGGGGGGKRKKRIKREA
jgi:hypothetical protein